MSSLFPLPLTPFERYLWMDDQPEYPMAFWGVLSFDGEMDREAFEAAVDSTVARHPLLACLIDAGAKPWPCWTHHAGLRPYVHWGALGEDIPLPNGEPIDLTREVGIRFWGRVGDGRTELTIQIHHCVSDGVGYLRLIGDLLGAYSRHSAQESPQPDLPPVDAGKLAFRGISDFRLPEPITKYQAIRATLREAFLWFWKRPVPLMAPPRSSSERTLSAGSLPDLQSLLLDAETTQALLSVARSHGATLNDLLLRDLFLAMLDWNTRDSAQRPGRWFRVNLPVNMRGRIHDAMPAANVMSYTFLTRRAEDCRDPLELLSGIRNETQLIKRWNLGSFFLAGLTAVQRFPGMMRLFAAGDRCHATAVHSFLGDVSRRLGVHFPKRDGRLVMGNLVFQRIVASPPVRPRTRVAIALALYNRELTIAMRRDRRSLSEEEGRQFLDLLSQRIQQTIAQEPA